MARLPRLAIAGEVHLVGHAGHNRQAVFLDAEDRVGFLTMLRDAQLRERVSVHAYALLTDQVWLLLTPPTGQALGRMMQTVGRRHTVAFNRRHGHSGTLWDGRFRSTVVERGLHELEAMLFIEQAPLREGLVSEPGDHKWGSARHHLGGDNDPIVTDTTTYWNLGNTPFDRAAAYARLLEEPLRQERVNRILAAVQKGWALASTNHLEHLGHQTARPLQPRKRGRPASGR